MVTTQDFGPQDQGRGSYARLKDSGDSLVAVGDYRRARSYYQAAVAVAPERVDAYLGLGAAAAGQQDWQAARTAFDTARAIEPTCAEAYAGLAMLCQQRQEYASAFDWYLKCLELDTDNLVALLGLFQTSCCMGTFAKIIGFLEAYLLRHSDDVAVLFCLASLYARDGRLTEARDAAVRVLAAEPEKAEAAELLAKINQHAHQTT